ncbi:hypothetical protein MGU_11154 [Metarhizium guizhouense ARSEF 977]|uniref:Transcription factor domain-containing protein n=1 Tax=Metarhizium guizhouense (strain ARSEF 977) TaxID=1276136 RepID=A0A0B4GG95_METGA|nr:hypothetical protein MGU_11154 [Metarhizium guizhouense ARSEF 977]
MRFLNETDHYLYGISARFEDTESIRRASTLLFTAICTVSALQEHQGEALFQLCSLELRRLVSDFVFASAATVDDFQGLCIASFWLSDMSWSVSGLAIRRAFEFQLGHSFQIVVGDKSVQEGLATKIRFTSQQDALACLRVWYLFFICDHHLSIIYARPSTFGMQATVSDWERYLNAVPESSTDVRIAGQIELLLLLDKVTQLLGPNFNTRMPSIFKPQLESFDQQLDQWVATWNARYDSYAEIGDFARKALTLHYLFSKLFLYSHVFRGLSSNRTQDAMPTEFFNMATSAVTSARSVIDLVTQDDIMKTALVAIPHYYHTFVAYACSFLLKVHTEYHNHLGLECEQAFRAIHQVIILCQSSECASHHLVRWMGAGLQKLAINCRATSLQQCVQDAHQLEQNYTLEPARSADGFCQRPGHNAEDDDSMSHKTDDKWDLSTETARSFSGIYQQLDPNMDQLMNSNADYANHASTQEMGTVEFQQDWSTIIPAFGSEYMGFGNR